MFDDFFWAMFWPRFWLTVCIGGMAVITILHVPTYIALYVGTPIVIVLFILIWFIEDDSIPYH